MKPPVHGLSPAQRAMCRHLAVQAARLELHHAPAVHYSQGSTRWEGIKDKLIAAHGEYPTDLDCSASVTWWLAQGLLFRLGMPDVVNGQHWDGGFTGTLGAHGRRVIHERNVISGDVVLYGSAPRFEHTAMIVGRHQGKLQVISHGSEAGPFQLDFNYRPVAQIRRMILAHY